ncbi:MAG: hypothetical protein H0W88_11590 [Parachlamydiaceae bacterium]|nr:hypothetical protein [Parachlamydiaceae bacterium]
MIAKVKETTTNSFNFFKDNVLEQLSETQKFVAIVALAVLATIAVARKLYKWKSKAKRINPSQMNRSHKVQPGIEGKIVGKIFYEANKILHVNGDFRLDRNGFLNGNGKTTSGEESFEGEFRNNKLYTGTCTRVFQGKKFEMLKKDFKYSVIEQINLDGTKVALQDAPKNDLIWKIENADEQEVMKISPQFEGKLKGKLIYPNRILDVDMETFRLDDEGHLNGNGKVDIGGYHHEGEFVQGIFYEGVVKVDLGFEKNEIGVTKTKAHIVHKIYEDGMKERIHLSDTRSIDLWRAAVTR